MLCVAGVTYAPGFAQGDEDEEEQPWNVSIATRYLSKYSQLGVDLSQDMPALTVEGGITHASGFTFGAASFYVTGSNGGYEQSSFHVGYERAITKFVSFAGTYTYHAYTSDTLNTLAGLKSTVTLGASFHMAPFVVSITYNSFLGDGAANFIGVGASASLSLGSLTLDPELHVSFVSQTLSETLLPKNRGNAKGVGKGLAKQQGASTTTSTTIAGLSDLTIQLSAAYSLGKGFAISLTPAYVYAPTDLAARTSQFLWAAAITYSMDF